MTENIPGTDKKIVLGGLICMLAGLWGIVVTLIFALSQIRMISPETPMIVVLESQGIGFLYLALHLIAFVLVTIIAYSAIRNRLHGSVMSRLFVAISIVLTGLSLIAGSTIGFFILPAAVALLAGGLLLRTSK